MPQRIRIECYPNDLTRTYHVTAQVSAELLKGGSFVGPSRNDPFRAFSFAEQKKELGDDTKATVLRFYDVDGVESVGVDTNKVEITRSPAYEWDEIESAIIIAIKEVVNWFDDSEMEIDYLFVGRIQPNSVTREQYEVEAERQRREYERSQYNRF